MAALVPLQDWDHVAQRYLLDPETGQLTHDGQDRPHGYVVLGADWGFVAVYAADDSLWLQSGPDRWPLRDVHVEYREVEDGTCLAKLSRAGVELRTFRYPNPRLDPVLASDPTFDEADAEQADLFLFLARNLNPAWAERVQPLWQAGLH